MIEFEILEHSEKLIIGNKIIDNQHKKIISQVNKILQKIELNRSINEIMREIDVLEDIVQIHTRTEEKYMRKNNYSEYDEHYNEHHILKSNIKIIKKAIFTNNRIKEFKNVIHSQVMNWYKEHMLNYDKKLANF